MLLLIIFVNIFMLNNLPISDFDDFSELDGVTSSKDAVKELTKHIIRLSINVNELYKEQKRANDQRETSWADWIPYYLFAGFILFFFSKIINNAINLLTHNSVAVVNHVVSKFQQSQNQTLGVAFNAMPQIIGNMMNSPKILNALTQGGQGVSNRLAFDRVTQVNDGATLESLEDDIHVNNAENKKQNPKQNLKRSDSQELEKKIVQDNDLG